MRAYDLILKKRMGGILSDEEIGFLIDGYVKDKIPDYQMSAFAMAVYFQGFTVDETVSLTKHMINSGDTINLSNVKGCVVDKHSTGGVADTTTIILVPLVAAAGVPVVKMSGRGLGHTGGTIDKLEAIPGFNVDLSVEQIIEKVNKTGAVISGQTGNLVPADKKLYALRDVTATVDINSLIASSVMSKKIAAGAQKIVLDVKVGKGAFMKSLNDATSLAKTMVQIGNNMGRETVAYLTNMDQPLGCSVGNSIEVQEAIDTLKGNNSSDLLEVSLELASEMIVLAGKCKDKLEAKELLIKIIESGKAIEKLAEIIESQKGNPRIIDDYSLFPGKPQKNIIEADNDGYIWEIDAEKIGMAAMSLGAGREKKSDEIFLEVGIKLNKKIGDKIAKGEELAVIYSRAGYKLDIALKLVNDAIVIKEEPIKSPTLIYGRISI